MFALEPFEEIHGVGFNSIFRSALVVIIGCSLGLVGTAVNTQPSLWLWPWLAGCNVLVVVTAVMFLPSRWWWFGADAAGSVALVNDNHKTDQGNWVVALKIKHDGCDLQSWTVNGFYERKEKEGGDIMLYSLGLRLKRRIRIRRRIYSKGSRSSITIRIATKWSMFCWTL